MATKSTDVDIGPSRKTGAIRKQIIRNTEKPIREQPFIRDHIKIPSATRIPLNEQFKLNIHSTSTVGNKSAETNDPPTKSYKKFRQPELSSTLEVAERLEAIKLAKPRDCKRTDDMTPKSKTIATNKIAKKLNVPHTKHIFDNLTPINVNDSVLAEEIPKFSKKSSVTFRSSAEMDPVPNLADYLTPIDPLILHFDDTNFGIDKDKESEQMKIIQPRRTTSREYLDMYNFFEKINKW